VGTAWRSSFQCPRPGLHSAVPSLSGASGHATFGGAIFQALRKFFGADNIPFTFVSDVYNSVTKDNDGTTPVPLRSRSFHNLIVTHRTTVYVSNANAVRRDGEDDSIRQITCFTICDQQRICCPWRHWCVLSSFIFSVSVFPAGRFDQGHQEPCTVACGSCVYPDPEILAVS